MIVNSQWTFEDPSSSIFEPTPPYVRFKYKHSESVSPNITRVLQHISLLFYYPVIIFTLSNFSVNQLIVSHIPIGVSLWTTAISYQSF